MRSSYDSTTATLTKHALRPLCAPQSASQERCGSNTQRALRRVAVIFEPVFDVVNPIANVPTDAITARSVATRPPAIDRSQRNA
jgi:hypothetical protein